MHELQTPLVPLFAWSVRRWTLCSPRWQFPASVQPMRTPDKDTASSHVGEELERESSLSLSDCWHCELWGQLALGCPQNPLSQYPVPHFHTRLKQLAAALLMYPAEDWWLVWHIWALKVIETAASAHMAAEAGCAKSVAWAAPTSGKLAVINPQIWPAYAEPLIKTAGGWGCVKSPEDS